MSVCGRDRTFAQRGRDDRRRGILNSVVMVLSMMLAGCAAAQTASIVRVGPGGDVATIAAAARLAGDGGIVEVQAGEYHGDVAVWLQKRLTIRAVGGRAVLFADGKAAEGKGIWVIRNGAFEIDGFDFVGVRVRDRNGAGIRFERGSLVVRNSRFLDNETGLMTGNVESTELLVEGCEFRGPAEATGLNHNLYVGLIGRLTVRDSWSHRGRTGHLLKSRARENQILHNRLSDVDGDASYELEFPNGGMARVIGNFIEQSAATSNPVIVSFGAEGYRWPVNDLAMSNNTVVNLRPAGSVFVRVAAGPASATLAGNTWVGTGRLQLPVAVVEDGNVTKPLSAPRDVADAHHGPSPGRSNPDVSKR